MRDSTSDSRSRELSEPHAQELVYQVAAVSAQELPLAAGLRAAAAEAPRRVAAALRELADLVEQGMDVASAAERLSDRMPPHLCGAVAAASRTGRMAEVLFDVVEHQRDSRRVRLGVAGALAYPALLLVLAIVLFSVLQVTVIHSFQQIFYELELELGAVVRWAFWWSDYGAWMLLSMVLMTLVTILLAWRLLSRARVYRILGALPLAGAIWRWSGHAELVRLLSILLAREVPLSEALKLSCDSASNADVAGLWRGTITEVQGGGSLSRAIATSRRMPLLLVPYVAWGERSKQLSEALQSISEMMEQRTKDRCVLVRLTVPPLVTMLVLVGIAFSLMAIMVPMILLIQGLT